MPEYPLSAHDHNYIIEADGRLGDVISRGIPYEADLLEHIYEQRFKGLALDVGAHIGNHTLWFAVVCGLTVHAFEPIEVKRLRLNVARNGIRKVKVHPFALGAQEGWATAVGKGELAIGAGTLPVRMLDNLKLVGVGLIKIDVEGMEPEVLAGGEKTIRRDRPAIFAEARKPEDHEAIAALLIPWGYRMVERFASRSVASPVERWDAV
jgi:FkbM family methyltransferase